jgi:DNA-binding Xre family transcriptional regulator
MERSIRVFALESALKKKALSRKDLVCSLGVSDETIEKIFKTKRLSLKRFLKICQKLNLTFHDLLSVSFSPSDHQESGPLTMDQEHYFCQNTKALCFFDLLVQSNDLKTTQFMMNLDKRETEERLNQLKEWGVLKKTDSQIINFPHGRVIPLQEEGPLKKVLTLKAKDEIEDCEDGALMDSYKLALLKTSELSRSSILKHLEDLTPLILEEEETQPMIDRFFTQFGLFSTICVQTF